MKKLTLSLMMAFCTMGLFAQELANFNFGRVNVVSPEIGEQSVTFRIQAPQAQNVQVSLSWQQQPVAMTKNQQGVWEVSVPRPAAELYTYNFVVDGVKVNDANNIFMQRDGTTFLSVLLIPGKLTENYFEANKRGDLHQVWYESPTLGMERRMFVYTPHGYNDMKEPLPVLYLLHGAGGDEDAWSNMGRTCQIMDNLIEKGQAKPMIVVMPNGNASQEAAPGETSEGLKQPSFMLPKTMDGSFEEAFPEIVAFVDKNYRTQAKKSSRAIAGLSMGGFHAMHISKENADMFDYVGLFSAAVFRGDTATSSVYADMEQKLKVQFAMRPRLYWIAIGDKDFLYEENVRYRALLDAEGYDYQYFESGDGHVWKNWRIYLSKFVPMLFK